ncbi:helix-turn-helix domain-containing protein [Thermodesulfobacteriota bacterium]
MVYERFHAALTHVVSRGGRGTQASLAQRAGISKSYVTQLLKGKRRASKRTQEDIARAFGYTYEYFLTLGRRMLIKSPPAEQIGPQFPEYMDSEDMGVFYMRVSDGMPLRWHLSANYRPILPEDQIEGMCSADCIENHEKWLAVMRQEAGFEFQ